MDIAHPGSRRDDVSKLGTEQEDFWIGEFGDSYIARNDSDAIVAGNVQLFSQALRKTAPKSILEIGANIGMNLAALQVLFPTIEMTAVEINATAASELSRRFPGARVENCSVLDSAIDCQFELVLTKGVLIHLNPGLLSKVYRKISDWAERYVLFAEYYNPSPLSIPYRGHSERLFKRDFAGEFLSQHPEFDLRDYGFVYHGDPAHPDDDITWFLMERRRK